MWNNNYWDKNYTKAIQVICAIGIIFHHMAQKTCAPWLPDEYIVHGLDIFLNAGYLFVGVFFFCSGYGLYKSVKANPDYLKGFIGKHFRPIILLYIISNICFIYVGQTTNNYCWFIYAILYLYFAFFISFKYCKSDKWAIIVLSFFIALYILLCELLVEGGWCYNTIGIFLAGFLFAKYADIIVEYIRKKYLVLLCITVFVLIITFFSAIKLNELTNTALTKSLYNFFRFSTVLVQFISSLAFSVFIFEINQKISINNKVLAFLGSMTLELYLIHVLFVEMFSYSFGGTGNDGICYIKNLFLYILVVLVSSFASAYLLLLMKKGANFLYEKYNHIFAAMKRDFKKVLIAFFIIVVGITALLIITDKSNQHEINKNIDEYVSQNIQFIPFYESDDSNACDDGKIATYIVGDGEETIVILKGINDYCATLTKKALADELSKKYKVVVIDYLGSGFSSDFQTERNIENICKEIHFVTDYLHLSEYTLFAERTSSLYAQFYVNNYPGEVKKVITLDGEITSVSREMLNVLNTIVFNYARTEKELAYLDYFLGRLLHYCGYKAFIWPLWQPLYTQGINKKYYDMTSYILFKNYQNKSIRNERLCMIESYLIAEELKYPSDIAVIDFVSEGRKKYFENNKIDMDSHLNNLCENNENHKIISLVDATYVVAKNPKALFELIAN